MSQTASIVRTVAAVGAGSIVIGGLGGGLVATGFPRHEPGKISTGQAGVGLLGVSLVGAGLLLPVVGVTDLFSSVSGGGKAAIAAIGRGATLLAGAAAYGGWNWIDQSNRGAAR